MRVSGVPFDQGDHPRGPFTPTAIVLHRTYGGWSGDSAVGKHGRWENGELKEIGFHFLIGKKEGQWLQFYDSATKCSHAKGANSWSIGIELTGTNEDPLTDWQVRALAWIVAQLCDHHGIPREYAFGGKRRPVKGLLPHALVPGSNHTDFVTLADWERVKAHWATPAQVVKAFTNTTTATPQAPSNPPPPPTPAASEQLAEVAAALEFCRHAIVGDGHTVDGPAVVFVQTALNARGAQLLVDGRWGPATRDVVRWFQSLRGLTPDGVVGPATWDALYPR